MNFDTTYGNLKKRIFDILDEYSSSDDTVFVADTDKNIIASKIPDAVNSSLVRMYESLPFGKGTSFQRLNFLRPIYYDREGVPSGDKSRIEFYTPVSAISMFFRFFGSGNISIFDKDNTLAARMSCSGSESVSNERKQLSVAGAGNYTVSISGNMKIFDFAVYENDGKVNIGGLCAPDFASFGLPDDMQRLISVSAGTEEVGKDEFFIENGWGFIKKSECENCTGVSVTYTKKAPVICESTEDAFIFPMSPLCFEALICLAASELCREQDAGKHTKLIYKYNDLCEGLRENEIRAKRNSFFGCSQKKRW